MVDPTPMNCRTCLAGPSLGEAVIYELQSGTFTEQRHLRVRPATPCPICAELGITSIELMPGGAVLRHPRWVMTVCLLYAPSPGL